jgi:alkanesulfonate monooxygenase SsuD/methylene tetrahydromethanopterin reductase-like flavin-dependent oxidoreductase (luciferase family)
VTAPGDPALRFGVSLPPRAAVDLGSHLELVAAAEAGGLDLVGIMDHPYIGRDLDTLSLLGMLLARTERLRFFPDVANLPLRPPAVLAKAFASLDLLSGGRVELGIGAGGYWDRIQSLGAERLSAGASLDALEEAIALIRAVWSGEPRVSLDGRYYRLEAASTGPRPAHPIGIWIGAVGPRAFRLTGRLADGWAAPIPSYLPYEDWAGAQETIDEGARAAGRDPRQITRIAQLVGTVTERPASEGPGAGWPATGADPIRASPGQWAAILAHLHREVGFDSFVLWPERASVEQVERFATQVVPHTRQLAEDRGRRA